MIFNEFGKKENPTILLMHAMLQDWNNLWGMLKPLEEEYRVIVPAMSGMYENSPEFTSFADQCHQIEIFLKENYDGKLRGVYGISQGATILAELLARNNVRIDIAILDGVYVAHQGKLAAFGTIQMFRSLQKNNGKPPKIMNGMMKLMGLGEEDYKMLNGMFWNVSKESMKRNLYENYTYRINPELKNTETMIYLWCGSKEPYVIKSHKILKQYLQHYEEEIFTNLGHGQLLFNQSPELCKKLSKIFSPTSKR